MARKRRWSRYRPPAERRTESGQPVDQPRPRPEAGPRTKPVTQPVTQPISKPTSRPRSKAKSKPRATGTPSRGKPFVVLGVVVAVVVAIVLAVRAGNDDDYRSGGVERKLLDETFVRDGLTTAAAELPGQQPVAVRLNEYSLTVEFYDPNADVTRYVERNSYSDDLTIRVSKNRYTEYKPVPFALSEVDPARMVAAAEQALDRTEDPYTWEVVIRVEQDEDTPRMIAHAGGKDNVDITSAP